MSLEREEVLVTGISLTSEDIANLTDEQLEARVIQVLDRGVIVDRVALPPGLPPHLHGEWRRPDEVEYWSQLGFRDGSEYVKNRSIHSDGARPMVGDVMFVVCEKRVKEAIDKVRNLQFLSRNARPGSKNKSKEEKDFEAIVKKDTGGIVPTITESSEAPLVPGGIAAAVAAAESQLKPATP